METQTAAQPGGRVGHHSDGAHPTAEDPAAEQQAIDRTHRIGQAKTVMVYRLIAADTIEEKVVALQERKRELFARVVDGGGAIDGALTPDDIRGLLDV